MILIQAYKTTDNKIFENTQEAKEHQVILDLSTMYNQTNILDSEDFIDMLKDNKTKLLELIPKLK